MTQLSFYIVSDIHGYIFPTDFSKRNQNLPMGLLKVNQLIEQERQQDDYSFKIDNGDFLQGSPLCHYLATEEQSSQPLTDIYNCLNFDFGTLGNHEFNYGLPYLQNTLNHLHHPILCANIFDYNNAPLTGQGVSYFKRGEITIGVIGLTTQFIPNWEQPANIKGLTFNSAVETLKCILPDVRKKSDVVVVSYHGGFERSLDTDIPTEELTGENEGFDILERFHKDIDVLITGHQHRDIAMIKNDTAIIQPGTRGTEFGKVTLTLDHEHQITDKQSTLVSVPSHLSLTLSNNDHSLLNELEDWLDTDITTLSEPMLVTHQFEARTHPHSLINLINYILLEKSGADIACTALFDSANGFDEKVTMRDIINNYPFPNTFKVIELSGKDIKLAIERSASYFDIVNHKITVNKEFLEPKPQHFNYDIFAGIQYTIHVGHPYGERVSDLQINDAPLQSDQIYTICVNNYRAVGGGNYDMYVNKPVIKDIQIEGAQLLIDYLSHNDLSQIPQVIDFNVVK